MLETALASNHRYAEATELFRDATSHEDSPQSQGDGWMNWYNFACVAIAANRPDDALQYLRGAINRGYKDADRMMTDEDLKNLRHDAKFLQLVAELKGAAGKPQTPQTKE